MDEELKAAWEHWLGLYMTMMSKNHPDPVIARMAAKRKAEESYKPVFEAGFFAGKAV
jgi:hypothetical protein